MEKLITLCLSVLLFSAVTFGQNIIITTKSDTLTGTITTFIGKTLTYTTKDDEQKAIKIENVSAIFGQMPLQRANAIIKANPLVVINITTIPDPVSVKLTQAKSYNEKTPGDLIQLSARLRLAGFILPTVVSSIASVNSAKIKYKIIDGDVEFYESNSKVKNIIYISAGVAGVALYIAGEVIQVKAGKLMNKNKNLSFAPASEGIGIALKF